MKGRKTGGRDFEPGHNTPGPGRPPVPDALRGVKGLTPEILRRMIADFWDKPVEEWQRMAAHPFPCGGQRLIARFLCKAFETADIQVMEFLLNRSIGKVKDVVEVTQKVELPSPEEALRLLQNDYARQLPAKVEVDEL